MNVKWFNVRVYKIPIKYLKDIFKLNGVTKQDTQCYTITTVRKESGQVAVASC